MRIVIDMQGAQTESRFRGIGRYTISLARSIVRNRSEHEVILALNGMFPDTVGSIRAEFSDLLLPENIRLWHATGPVFEADKNNNDRREVAELIREAFLASLQPDIVLVTSLFEGFGDDAVVSIGVFDTQLPTAVILYDLIPLISPDIHFKTSKLRQEHYKRKIASLKRSKCLLAISESARQEAFQELGFPEASVVNISGACDASFRILDLGDSEKKAIAMRLGISKPFVLYTGGADDRKNLHRLVESYAKLPLSLRKEHQLVLAGKMPEGNLMALRKICKDSRLAEQEVVFTGYISDEDLVGLYNICDLFVFPSLHEGFGLPPLEAMACGAPVIAANSSSLPEVIGLDEAMFDPISVLSIRDKMQQVLSDDVFRAKLIKHGSGQFKRFSWDKSAKKTLEFLEKFSLGSGPSLSPMLTVQDTSIFRIDHKKILLVKLDHMGDLLLAIPAIVKLKSRYPYAVLDIIVGNWNVAIAESLNVFNEIHTLDFFKKQSAMAATTTEADVQTVLRGLGTYDIVIDLRRQSDTRFIICRVKANLKVGYETFDHSIDSQLDIALKSYSDIPFAKTPLNSKHISLQMIALVDALPVNPNDYIKLPVLFEKRNSPSTSIALFPNAGNKVKEWEGNKYVALAEALLKESVVKEINVYFSNRADARRSGFVETDTLKVHAGMGLPELLDSLSENILCVANNSFGAHLASYLGLSVIGVYGGHETVDEWAPVFGSSYVVSRNAHCSPCHIAKPSDCKNAMYCLADISVNEVRSLVLQEVKFALKCMGNKTLQPASRNHVRVLSNTNEIVKRLVNRIAGLKCDFDDEILKSISCSISSSVAPFPAVKQLFVDVSEFVRLDAKTGIQRVIRSLLRPLMENAYSGLKVTPVYARVDYPGYFYAHEFANEFLGLSSQMPSPDAPVDYFAGDIFLGLDLQQQIVCAQADIFQKMRICGVRVLFVVYDLLPVTMPQYFPEELCDAFRRWLHVISEADGAICISNSVAKELKLWRSENVISSDEKYSIDYFHLGADIDNAFPSIGLPRENVSILEMLGSRINFLMVGTIEPRKGHLQVLKAFEELWKKGVDVTLVIVGKRGWNVDELISRIESHWEINNRLFWLEGITDEFLEQVYGAATCLIAASYGEGFGLPLIESAKHKLPILARDIPVFREVIDTSANYFKANDGLTLAGEIADWLSLYKGNEHQKPDGIEVYTWEESANELLRLLYSEPRTDG